MFDAATTRNPRTRTRQTPKYVKWTQSMHKHKTSAILTACDCALKQRSWPAMHVVFSFVYECEGRELMSALVGAEAFCLMPLAIAEGLFLGSGCQI